MMQLWTNTKLLSLDFSLRKRIKFYAPLIYSLDFHGIDPVTYARAGSTVVLYRGGIKTIPANVPPFVWGPSDAPIPLGLQLHETASLQFSAKNELNDANTLIWFENTVWYATPTTTNPFDSGGVWTRSHGVGGAKTYVRHILKADSVLATEEIIEIQRALTDSFVAYVPPSPPVNSAGVFITETPAGTRNGSNITFTLSQTPDLNSLIIFAHGAAIERVASSPGTLEFTISGTTITMGLAPTSAVPFFANYVVA